MRKFEKISFEQYQKDVNNDKKLYEELSLPRRSTKTSAGYDFFSPFDFTLSPGEIKKIPTAIKASMEDDEVLFLFVRSNIGFKYNVRLTNQVGVIDHDYYNNIDNEGHIFIKLQNEGNTTFEVKRNDRIVQGVFTKYLTVENEEVVNEVRIGGIGSTNKE